MQSERPADQNASTGGNPRKASPPKGSVEEACFVETRRKLADEEKASTLFYDCLGSETRVSVKVSGLEGPKNGTILGRR